MTNLDVYYESRNMGGNTVSTKVRADGGRYRVLVPLSNPEHERDLIELASAIAEQRGGVVVAVHIVTVPDQTALDQAVSHASEIDAESADLLASARSDANLFGADIETHTIFSHRGFEQIFDTARDYEADLVVMGWGKHGHARVETRLEELTRNPPCDFIVLRDQGFNPEHILVPTAGGPDSDLSAEVAFSLRRKYGSEVTLLHVADDLDEGETFLREWAAKHDLEDATLQVESGDVETAIERAARDTTMVVIGATEQGLLARLVTGSLVLDIVGELECSVLLAERPTRRSFRERLFGSGK